MVLSQNRRNRQRALAYEASRIASPECFQRVERATAALSEAEVETGGSDSTQRDDRAGEHAQRIFDVGSAPVTPSSCNRERAVERWLCPDRPPQSTRKIEAEHRFERIDRRVPVAIGEPAVDE